MTETIRVEQTDTEIEDWQTLRSIFELYMAERVQLQREAITIRDVVPIVGTKQFDVVISDGAKESVLERIATLPSLQIIDTIAS